MFQMGPLKALGPDGFPARFYQKNWAVVKQDMIAIGPGFFHSQFSARWDQ
jgi:hypothetical protein